MRGLLRVEKQQYRWEYEVGYRLSQNSLYMMALYQDDVTIIPIRKILATCELDNRAGMRFQDAGFTYWIQNEALVEKLWEAVKMDD
ncbi:hypothetical protein [Paenilisteria newyorkensis]|uniref:hypothetical protein n=1 Tax=Listeria newyorkensis TaxID=1497681 RepID=UPI000669E3E0|nr:hypothetical protein [Listeria newyorkensis]KMT62845.1 hypothetical protein X559_0786 [Listeria newyorkensis]